MQCIMKNQKTGLSVDFTTNCPKRRTGNACKYCYVECSRNTGFNAKKVIEHIPYRGEVLRLRPSTIERENSKGGIRLFSFGDYMSEHRTDVIEFLGDCRVRGLRVKAITKQVEFITDIMVHFTDILTVQLSVDNVGDGVEWKTALALREQYPSNVLLRAVILNSIDLFVLGESVDIVTFNHANVPNMDTVTKWTRYGVQSQHNNPLSLAYGKTCCTTGNCQTCPIKCGVLSL